MAAETRWEREHAACAGEPVRRTRTVTIEVRDSHWPMTRLRLEAEPKDKGWSRWAVWHDGKKVGTRRLGRDGLGQAIARLLA